MGLSIKTQDRSNRRNMLEAMKIALKHGMTEQAKSLGESSATLKEKINTHDYSKDQSFEEIWKQKVNEGCERMGVAKIY